MIVELILSMVIGLCVYMEWYVVGSIIFTFNILLALSSIHDMIAIDRISRRNDWS